MQHGAVTIVVACPERSRGDGDGNRVAKTAGGVTTRYLVSELNPTGYVQVLDELQGGTVARSYTYGLDLISQRFAGGQRAFYSYDGHGSVRQLTNSAGNVTDSYNYDGFGNLLEQTGSTPNNYLFAGEQFDAALGLYYNRARYLNANTGRFWTVDTDEGTLEDPFSLHRYVYAEANPVDNVDPSGNESASLAETIGELPAFYTIAAMAVLTLATACAAVALIQHGPGFCGSKNQPLTLYRGLSGKNPGQLKPEYFSGDGLSLYETLYPGRYKFKWPFVIDYPEPKISGTRAANIYEPPFVQGIADIIYTPEYEDPSIGQGHWSLRLKPGIAFTVDLLELFIKAMKSGAIPF